MNSRILYIQIHGGCKVEIFVVEIVFRDYPGPTTQKMRPERHRVGLSAKIARTVGYQGARLFDDLYEILASFGSGFLVPSSLELVMLVGLLILYRWPQLADMLVVHPCCWSVSHAVAAVTR